jgi:hypothetical protein
MKVLVGFDPGGKGTSEGEFGWAVLEDAETLPLSLLKEGLARHAEQALKEATAFIDTSGAQVAGIGIDAPLTWVSDGRNVDVELAAQRINSLRGACLVQGWLVAKMAEIRFPEAQISESHPKMILKRRFKAVAKALNSRELGTLVSGRFGSDHTRDAALCALSAWAMVRQRKDWEDLASRDPQAHTWLKSRAYWLPVPAVR